MKLLEVISNLKEYNEDSLIYAKKINGAFSYDSETVVLDLTEEELELKANEISDRKCPGLDYFLEVFLANEKAENIEGSVEEKCKNLIYYVEND